MERRAARILMHGAFARVIVTSRPGNNQSLAATQRERDPGLSAG